MSKGEFNRQETLSVNLWTIDSLFLQTLGTEGKLTSALK